MNDKIETINRPEDTRIEGIKKNYSELKDTITNEKNALASINSKIGFIE